MIIETVATSKIIALTLAAVVALNPAAHEEEIEVLEGIRVPKELVKDWIEEINERGKTVEEYIEKHTDIEFEDPPPRQDVDSYAKIEKELMEEYDTPSIFKSILEEIKELFIKD